MSEIRTLNKIGNLNLRENFSPSGKVNLVKVAGEDLQELARNVPITGHGRVAMKLIPSEGKSTYCVGFDSDGKHQTSPGGTETLILVDGKTNKSQVISGLFRTPEMESKNLAVLGNQKAQALFIGDEVKKDPAVVFCIDKTASKEDIDNLRKELNNKTGMKWV